MRDFSIIKTTLLSLLFFITIGLNAQEIGKAWEFNEDGNFEGIILSNNFKDSLVENGMLKATVANVFPFVSSEPFELEAADYGIIQIRMKIPGATSGKFNWFNDTGDWGFVTFETTGDSTFQEFELPVYLNDKWAGKITKIMSLGFNPTVGSQVEIDYIRIVRKGPKPTITNFNPVIKQNVEVPLFATIRNEGDIATRLSSKLILPEGVTLVSGSIENDHGIVFKELTDTLNWTIMFNSLGEYDLTLKLFNETDTTEKVISVNVTDQYWVQNKFFLSAWSSPSLTTDAYDYYANANFEMVLAIAPNEASAALAEQYGMEYQLRAGSLIGENKYLRAPDNTVPDELTPDDLAKLDGMISTFKDKEGVLGYYLTDEPNAKAFDNLSKVVSYLREKDPTRLSYINLFPTYANNKQLGTSTYDEHVKQFLDIVKPEILSYDHYHFFNGYDGGGYFNNLGIIRKWSLAYDIPFCNIIQAIGTNDTPQSFLNWRTPSEAEHRWLVYTSLAYGAKGIVWFHWDSSWGLTGSPDRDSLYASIQKLNQEINNIGDIIISLNSKGVYHSKTESPELTLPLDGIVRSVSENADLVIGYFKDSNDKDYFILMNKNYNDSTVATITLNGTADGLQYFDVFAKEWKAVENDSSSGKSVFDVELRSGGGKLFTFGKLTDVIKDDLGFVPNEFNLKQNYPNPFNPSTTIKYSIPSVTHPSIPFRALPDGRQEGKERSDRGVLVTLNIYDILGRKVTTLVNKEQKPGNYEVNFNANELASGLYFYRMAATLNGGQAGSFMKTMKMILLK
ncbi:MAG: hypothetical protein GXO85_13095 [Chlorobi bacterium]|nr:hypothetical protein [Chlorobiota bacterium]